MKSYRFHQNDEVLIVKRGKILTLLQTALNNREFQFARQASLIWLGNYPGDLLVNFIYASVLAELGDTEMAVTNLEKIIRFDPEFTEAMSLLSQLTPKKETNEEYRSALAYLQRMPQIAAGKTAWLNPMISARQAYESGDLASAEKSILNALAYNPTLPLPAIFHMQIVRQMKNETLLETLSGIYASRWPNCIQIKIFSALIDLQKGDDSTGVEKLHWSAAHDVSGQVINRLLSPNHAFKPLWPEDLKVYLDIPIPSSVAVELGWNALSNSAFVAPSTPTPESIPPVKSSPTTAEDLLDSPTLATKLPSFMTEEVAAPLDYTEVPPDSYLNQNPQCTAAPQHSLEPTLQSNTDEIDETRKTVAALGEIQAEFDKMAKHLKKSELSKTDARFPSYVLLSSRSKLEAKYGINTANVVIEAMNDLSLKITALPNWNSLVFIPDDLRSAQETGLTPILAADAWKIKLALSDLDKKLASKGEMIGALLIVGGDDIVPFHRLPNPTDDSDTNVASDNPYATTDENYFIQQWPVGRIPDEAGTDAGFLLEQLRFLNNEYDLKIENKKSLSNFIFGDWFTALREFFQQSTQRFQKTDSIGYCAEVWQVPSAEVFSVIDQPTRLKLSPPIMTDTLLDHQRSDPRFAYFNLHGLKDSPEWFGQKDIKRQSRDPEYPVAVKPENFSPKSPAPEIIFSEACYGADIFGKYASESMALSFLANGARAFAGSSCIAYGSVSKPLIAADLLAHEFWIHVQNGVSVGYALMRAKMTLAQRMTESQGYLDGEDQKTILSFVLYGDPLVSKQNIKQISKPLFRPIANPSLKTISDSAEEMVVAADEMPPEILDQVKKTISAYLPGLDDATVFLNPQLTNFSLDPEKMRARKSKAETIQESQRYVVTLKKSREFNQQHLDHYARMTFDQRGQIIKMSSSR